MKICANPQAIKPDLSRRGAAPTLVAYVTALSAYQRQRTAERRVALFRSYRGWISTFLDDEAEADRAANTFLIALQTQPPESREKGVAA